MQRRSSIALGSGLVVAATVGLAVSMTLILDQLKFEKKLTDLLRSRLEFLVSEVREQAEFGLTLGLALPELVTLQTQLDRDIASDSRLLSLVIHDEKDQPLFSAGPQAAHTQAADYGAMARGDGIWSREEGMALTLGTLLEGGFGEPVGGVLLRYSLTESRQHQSAVLMALALRAITVIAVAAMIALFGVTLLVRRLVWRFGPLARELAENPLEVADQVVGRQAGGGSESDIGDIKRVARVISASAREMEVAELNAARLEARGLGAGRE